jgi:formylglycine-generating enzyme required for sulfatase activity
MVIKSISYLALVGVVGLFALSVNPAGAAKPTLQATPGRPAGTVRTDAKGVKQVWVPAGCFTMGADDAEAQIAKLGAPAWTRRALGYEDPAREVCLTEGYWIDQFEVTNKQFQAFVDAGGYTKGEFWSEAGLAWLNEQVVETLPTSCGEPDADLPRVCVTWFEAEAYANWRGGRLPTEAEWEYAARGPKSLVYPWGNEWDAKRANVVDSEALKPVGSYPNGASWVGVQDMAGNAMEWVQDWLSADYPKLKVRDNPTGPEKGVRKIEKGGWWGSNAFVARASYKHYEDTPDYADHHIGFRIVTPDTK